MREIGLISILSKTSFGISSKSFTLACGIKTVLIPAENEKDLAEIPKNITGNLEIITVQTAQDVDRWALAAPINSKNYEHNPHVKEEDYENYLGTH